MLRSNRTDTTHQTSTPGGLGDSTGSLTGNSLTDRSNVNNQTGASNNRHSLGLGDTPSRNSGTYDRNTTDSLTGSAHNTGSGTYDRNTTDSLTGSNRGTGSGTGTGTYDRSSNDPLPTGNRGTGSGAFDRNTNDSSTSKTHTGTYDRHQADSSTTAASEPRDYNMSLLHRKSVGSGAHHLNARPSAATGPTPLNPKAPFKEFLFFRENPHRGPRTSTSTTVSTAMTPSGTSGPHVHVNDDDEEEEPRRIMGEKIHSVRKLFIHALCNGVATPRSDVLCLSLLRVDRHIEEVYVSRDEEMYFEELMRRIDAGEFVMKERRVQIGVGGVELI